LTRSKAQAREVPCDQPMAEHRFGGLEKVIAYETVLHISEDFREDPACELGIGLYALICHRDALNPEPAEREIRAKPARGRKIERVRQMNHVSPGYTEGCVFETSHESGSIHAARSGDGRRQRFRLIACGRSTSHPLPNSATDTTHSLFAAVCFL
jgi:hypothetical protein